MENQLKALKVAELRELLTKAAVPFASKINKADLIAKVLASQAAIDVYNSLHNPTDLLSPPEDVDWSNDSQQQAPPEPEREASQPAPAPAATSPSPAQRHAEIDAEDVKPAQGATAAAIQDPEEEKRRKRAERFGIPYVEAPKPRPPRGQAKKSSPLDDPKKLETRASRFGKTAASTAQKRSAPTETVDTEEQERRKKRAERFGTAPQAQKA